MKIEWKQLIHVVLGVSIVLIGFMLYYRSQETTTPLPQETE